MKTLMKLFAVALVGVLAFTGFAAGTGSIGSVTDAAPMAASGFGPGDGTGPVHDGDARPMDGSNSPWVTGDERLDRFQERFDLTDEQMDELQTTMAALIEDGASHDEIRTTVTEMLAEFGVEDPTLGPPADAEQRHGGFGSGHGAGHGSGGGHGSGPHGPADGSCQA